MIGHACCHGRSDGCPPLWSPRPTSRFGCFQRLTEAVMRQDKVVRGHREPELLFEPDDFFGKAMRPACETAIALPLRQVVTFDKTGVDRIAHRCMSQFV